MPEAQRSPSVRPGVGPLTAGIVFDQHEDDGWALASRNGRNLLGSPQPSHNFPLLRTTVYGDENFSWRQTP